LQKRDSFFERSLTRRQALGAAAGAGSIATATLLLGGCGDDDDTAPAETTTAPGTTTATSTTRTVPDELVVANEAEPDDLSPYFGSFAWALVNRQVYETLAEVRMRLTPAGVVAVDYVPMLAERWEQLAPDRFRFQLRRGVRFHDGAAWDAEAAKVCFDALLDAETATSLNKRSILAAGVKAIEIVDTATIDVVATAPTNQSELFIWLRLGFSAVSPTALAERGIAGLLETPVGTGPYQFDSWRRGREIRLSRYADYWGGEVTNFSRIRYIARPEASVRAQAVKSGEAHLAYNIGAEQASTLENSVVGGGFQSSSIRLNNTIAPTSDIRVRRAINYAIDRDGINKAIFGGTAIPIAFFAFQPVELEPFPYDPDTARRLIDEAGVAGAELELVYGENRIPEEAQLAEIYRASLEEIGLKVNLTRLEPRQYNEVGGLPFEQQPPLFLETTSSGNYGEIAGGLRDKYGCSGTGTFCNPELDAEFARLATLAGADRATLLQEVATTLHNEHAPRAWVLGVRQVHGLAANLVADFPENLYILAKDLRFA